MCRPSAAAAATATLLAGGGLTGSRQTICASRARSHFGFTARALSSHPLPKWATPFPVRGPLGGNPLRRESKRVSTAWDRDWHGKEWASGGRSADSPPARIPCRPITQLRVRALIWAHAHPAETANVQGRHTERVCRRGGRVRRSGENLWRQKLVVVVRGPCILSGGSARGGGEHETLTQREAHRQRELTGKRRVRRRWRRLVSYTNSTHWPNAQMHPWI